MKKLQLLALAFTMPVFGQTQGSLTFERWDNPSSDNTILGFQKESIGTRAPDLSNLTQGAGTTPNQADNFGARVRGSVTAPVAGFYTFFLTADDYARLYLGADASPFAREEIAAVYYWKSPGVYDGHHGQRSREVWLDAGEVRYIEAVLLDGGGGDHLSISWARRDALTMAETAVGSVGSQVWSEQNGVHGLTVEAGDFWGSSDNFAFKQSQWSGDGEFIAKVSDIQGGADAGKIGLMLREGLGQDARNAAMFVWSGGGVRFQSREVTGGVTTEALRAAGEPWLKLVRKGDLISGYSSADGITWAKVGERLIPGLAATLNVGFAATDNTNTNAGISASISEFSASPLVPDELIPAAQLASFATDPNDLDDDGLPDDWEVANGLLATDGFNNQGQYGDADGDGLSNFDEYALGSDPGAADALQGVLTRELWYPIYGGAVDSMVKSQRFYRSPVAVDYTAGVFTPATIGATEGERFSGHLTPTVSGTYRFWISGDDEAELWLSPDATPFQKKQIASVTDERFGINFSTRVDYDKFATQRSVEIDLVAGQKYYFEVLHVEGGDAQHVSVAWMVPGTTQRVEIPASAFSTMPAVSTDADGDSLPDAWEAANGLSALKNLENGQFGDPDQDGLDNLAEYQAGTDPFDSDSDDDGQSDGFENDRGTDPLLANGTNFFVEVPVDDFTAASAYWNTDGNGDLVSSERRGSIDYHFTVGAGEAGLFEVRLSAAAEGGVSALDRLPLRLEVDGTHADSKVLLSQNGSTETVYFRTAWLGEGGHTLRIHNDNYQANLRLRIADLDIYRFVDDGSGWIAGELDARNRLFLSPSPGSATSPAAIEGITSDFASASAASNGTPLDLRQGLDDGIYFDLPLDASGTATPLDYSFQSGAVTGNAGITWTTTNLHGTTGLKVRAGESIRATAFDSLETGTFTLSLDSQPDAAPARKVDFPDYLGTDANAAVPAWSGFDLAQIVSAAGVIQGTWQPVGKEAQAYHLNISGNTATFQLQFIDSIYTKVVKIQLTQGPEGIAAHQIYARYKNGNCVGENFDSNGASSAPVGGGGYGIISLTLEHLYAVPSVTNLTPNGAQAVGSPVVASFPVAGTHILTYTHNPADGSPAITGTTTVAAQTADFGPAFQLMTWNRRTWTPSLIPGDATVQAAEALSFAEETALGDLKRSFTANSYKVGTQHVLARLTDANGAPGRILARGEIESFEVARVDQTKDATIVHTYADGTRLMQISLVADDLPPNAEITLRTYYQGTTFENGGNELVLTSADFDQNGISEIYMLWGPDGEPRLCHYVKVTLSNQ